MYEGRGKTEMGGSVREGGGRYSHSRSPKKTRRREPGIIHSKSCRLPVPRSGGTNQIAE